MRTIDHLGDMCEGPSKTNTVFIMEEYDKDTNKYIDYKVIVGVDSLEAAKDLYADRYASEDLRQSTVLETDLEMLVEWEKDPKARTHPASKAGIFKVDLS